MAKYFTQTSEDSAKIDLITAKSFKLISEAYAHINYLKGTKTIADHGICQCKDAVMSKSEKGTASHWIKHRNISLSRKHKLQILLPSDSYVNQV